MVDFAEVKISTSVGKTQKLSNNINGMFSCEFLHKASILISISMGQMGGGRERRAGGGAGLGNVVRLLHNICNKQNVSYAVSVRCSYV